MEPVKLQTNCGASLFVVEMPQVNSVATGILVRAGTRDELWPQEAGLAHAFEHMVFRGTDKFPNSEELTGYLEKVGGYVNAWTNSEMTFFYNVLPADHFKRGVEYLHELLMAPAFKPECISLEMKIVAEEIKRRNDDPARLAYDLSEEYAYGDHPLGKNTLGTVEAVTGFNRENFVSWQQKFYYPENFDFIVIGKINPEAALEIFNNYFLVANQRPRNSRPAIPSCAPKQKVVVVKKDIEQVHLVLAAPIGNAKDRTTEALTLFGVMLDGGMSFPLFQELREKRGLCYAASADVSPSSDIGLFLFYVGTDLQKWPVALKTMLDLIPVHRANPKLFKDAKSLLMGRISIKYESPQAMLSKLAYDIALEGKPILVKETLEEIESLTLDEVTAAVDKYLKPENFVQVFVAPEDFTPAAE